MSEVTLINCFEIKAPDVTACLSYWDNAAVFMAKQPGFLDTHLYHALRDENRFQLINVARWTSVEDFQRAVLSESFKAITEPGAGRFKHYPGLFTKLKSIC